MGENEEMNEAKDDEEQDEDEGERLVWDSDWSETEGYRKKLVDER